SFERHERTAAGCRAGARAMEIDLWPASEDIAAACVTALAVPDGLTDMQVRDHCRSRYGVMISGGQGAGNLVRIGHMGPTAQSLSPGLRWAAVGGPRLAGGGRGSPGEGVGAPRQAPPEPGRVG